MTLPIDESWGLQTRIVPPGGGEAYDLAAGDRISFKVTGAHSDGGFTLFEFTSMPGHPGIPFHVHDSHEELWYILDGTLQLRVDDDVLAAVPGSTYLVPRGVPHAFWTEGPQPSRMLSLFAPAGFEGWFRERTKLLAQGKATVEALMALSAKYDQRVLEPLPATMLSPSQTGQP